MRMVMTCFEEWVRASRSHHGEGGNQDGCATLGAARKRVLSGPKLPQVEGGLGSLKGLRLGFSFGGFIPICNQPSSLVIDTQT